MPLGTNSLSVVNVTARDLSLADTANYYAATTATPGTGQVTGNPTTLVQTTPALVVFNGGLLNVYLIYLKLSETVVGGGAAVKNFTHSIDQGNRFTSGGAALTINNTNPMSGTKSNTVANFGAITATAATNNARTLCNQWFRSGTDVVGDVYEFHYGAPFGSTVGSAVATVANFAKCCPAVVLQPQSCYVLNIWSGTFSQGITFEVQLAFAEK